MSIDRSLGEGSRVTVRGVGPDDNLVLLNGRQMPASSLGETGPSNSRAFDFANLASESISALEVYRTSRSSTPTGGIGATVNIRPALPLDSRKRVASLGLKLVSDDSNDWLPEALQGSSVTPELSGTVHNLLGVNEQEFMAATQATFKLGIRFENWRNLGEDYIHSFGISGKDHWTAGFQHFWLKGRERRLAGAYGDYCLELRAAEEARFAHLPRGGMNYAFHLDATAYAGFLRRFCEGFGVRRSEGKIVDVQCDADSGDIRALRLDSGALIEGDLFIDCTGFRALLIGQTLKVPCEDWSHWLPCDSAVAVQTASVHAPVPYTRSIAREWGWQWRIPLQQRVGNGLVYSSRHIADDAARAALLAHIEGETLTQPRLIKFRPGQRSLAWSHNCVAIGLASGFIEPLESTSIHLIQRGVIRLMQMFPAASIRRADIDEYNRQTRDELEHIRDFIILHYHVTNRDDVAFWRECRAMDVPASLQHRIELFRQTARVFRAPNELFAENSWTQVMLGQGIVPEQHHPVADLMGDEELKHFLDDIRLAVNRTVAQLPAHHDYVQRYSGRPGQPAAKV